MGEIWSLSSEWGMPVYLEYNVYILFWFSFTLYRLRTDTRRHFLNTFVHQSTNVERCPPIPEASHARSHKRLYGSFTASMESSAHGQLPTSDGFSMPIVSPPVMQQACSNSLGRRAIILLHVRGYPSGKSEVAQQRGRANYLHNLGSRLICELLWHPQSEKKSSGQFWVLQCKLEDRLSELARRQQSHTELSTWMSWAPILALTQYLPFRAIPNKRAVFSWMKKGYKFGELLVKILTIKFTYIEQCVKRLADRTIRHFLSTFDHVFTITKDVLRFWRLVKESQEIVGSLTASMESSAHRQFPTSNGFSKCNSLLLQSCNELVPTL